jgi:hypothetical protein
VRVIVHIGHLSLFLVQIPLYQPFPAPT